MGEEIEEQQVESLSSNGHELRVKNFIWCEEEWAAVSHNDFGDGDDVIPTISLRGALNIDGEKSQHYHKVCGDMVTACHRWGFFKLVDHGVASEITENLKKELNEFFELPMEHKMKGARSTNMPLGYSATNVNYGRNLPWVEIIQLLPLPQMVMGFAARVLGDQHQLFSDALIEYMNALEKLGMTILEMLADGLGLASDFFTKNFGAKEESMIRVNRYPPCPLPEKCLGLGSHTDPHTLTILLQDDVGGLQVLTDDNQWVGVRPVPNSFVINIGDALKAWTNGALKSVMHRAVVNKEKSRLSVASFISPKSSALIDCPPQLLDPNSSTHPRKYVPFTWGDFRKELSIQKRVTGKGTLDRYLISPQ